MASSGKCCHNWRAESDPIGPPCYHSDNLSKVYDLRMMRNGMPLQYSYNLAPAKTVFFADGMTASTGTPNYRVLAASNSGSVMFHDIRQDFATADIQQLQQRLPAEICCAAVAPSGQLAAVGDNAGGLHLWASQEAGHDPRSCAYDVGTQLEAPPQDPHFPAVQFHQHQRPGFEWMGAKWHMRWSSHSLQARVLPLQ